MYRYWGDRVCKALYADTDFVVNLCSGEYTKLWAPYRKRENRMVPCRFLVCKSGRLRCLATASKIARGKMAQFVIKNHITDPQQLMEFDWDGYVFIPSMSTEEEWVFGQMLDKHL